MFASIPHHFNFPYLSDLNTGYAPEILKPNGSKTKSRRLHASYILFFKSELSFFSLLEPSLKNDDNETNIEKRYISLK